MSRVDSFTVTGPSPLHPLIIRRPMSGAGCVSAPGRQPAAYSVPPTCLLPCSPYTVMYKTAFLFSYGRSLLSFDQDLQVRKSTSPIPDTWN